MAAPASWVGRLRWRGGSPPGIRRKEAIRSSATLLNGGRGSAMLLLIEAALAHEDAKRVGPGDVVAGVAVQESPAQDVGAEKAPAGAHQGGRGRKAATAGALLLDVQVGEGVDLPHVPGEGRKRVVA